MTKKYTIQINYKTESGTLFPSYDEAILADYLEKSSLYIESYKLGKLVQFICDHFYISEKPEPEPEPELEVPNEAE